MNAKFIENPWDGSEWSMALEKYSDVLSKNFDLLMRRCWAKVPFFTHGGAIGQSYITSRACKISKLESWKWQSGKCCSNNFHSTLDPLANTWNATCLFLCIIFCNMDSLHSGIFLYYQMLLGYFRPCHGSEIWLAWVHKGYLQVRKSVTEFSQTHLPTSYEPASVPHQGIFCWFRNILDYH